MTHQLDKTFAALADPTRRDILSRLSVEELSVGEIAAPFDMSMPAVSKHLKVLERAGLITRTRDAQWRRCKLDATPLKQATDWISQYRQFWEHSFDQLDSYIDDLQVGEPDGRKH